MIALTFKFDRTSSGEKRYIRNDGHIKEDTHASIEIFVEPALVRTRVHFPVLGSSILPGSLLKYCSSIGRAWYSYCQGLRFEPLLYYSCKNF